MGPRQRKDWASTYFSLKSNNAIVLPLYVCWSAPNTKASRHPILLAWFKEEKRALLLPWVIPGQASQEHPVGGLCSKGASCSQLKVPSHCKYTSVHLPRPKCVLVQPPLQEVHQGLSDLISSKLTQREREPKMCFRIFNVSLSAFRYAHLLPRILFFPFIALLIFIHPSKPSLSLLF